MSHAERTMNDFARLRILSTFRPLEADWRAGAMRGISQKLAALCPLLLPQCFHFGRGVMVAVARPSRFIHDLPSSKNEPAIDDQVLTSDGGLVFG